MCEKTSCPFHNPDEGCTHPGAPAPDECDLFDMFPVTDNTAPEPPMYVKFTYADEWRHIPSNETFSVWTEFDLAMAAQGFQRRHGSDGSLIVFCTSDLIEWKVLGTITEKGALNYK
jgi:hypothetical protein